MEDSRFILNCRGRALDVRPHQPWGARVMGILNITPDSFSDGGAYLSVDAALRRAETLLNEGAVILDIGGESSRPKGLVYGAGAEAVSLDEERRRVLPVVEALRNHFPAALLSIDTYKAALAEEALDRGVHLLNDITGLRHDPEKAVLAAQYNAPLIVMHSVGTPGSLSHMKQTENPVAEVNAGLQTSIETAQHAGVKHLITDPGFGFGKSVSGNLHLMNAVDQFLDLGWPVLVGISRKSAIGAVLGRPNAPVPVDERLYGSLGATAVAVLRGASLVRTHDVRATVEMLRVLGETLNARPNTLSSNP